MFINNVNGFKESVSHLETSSKYLETDKVHKF